MYYYTPNWASLSEKNSPLTYLRTSPFSPLHPNVQLIPSIKCLMTAQRTTGPNRSRRSHTLGGCRTCRRRHVKCDQKRPACRTCRALSIPCEGFSDEVRWIGSSNASNDGVNGDRSGIRRQLYTGDLCLRFSHDAYLTEPVEQSRRSMTTSLGNDLVSGSIDASLNEIDSRSRDGNASATSDIVVGPFSVLNFTSPALEAEAPRPSDIYNAPAQHIQHVSPSPAPAIPSFDPGLGSAPPGILSPLVDPMNVMDDFLHWSDLLGFGNDSFSSLSQPLLDGDTTIDTYSQLPAPSTSSGMEQWVPGAPSDQRNTVQFATTQQIALDTTSTEVDVLSDSQFLFKHFQDTLIPQMMVMPLGDKCPWKILNLPAAVMTYSDITFLSSRSISHASLANLYGVLACSAIHLSSTPGATGQADHWRQVAHHAFNQAKEHMLLSLKHETQLPKKSKYKDQMMAICILAEFSVSALVCCRSKSNDCRLYLVNKNMHGVLWLMRKECCACEVCPNAEFLKKLASYIMSILGYGSWAKVPMYCMTIRGQVHF